MTHTESIYNRIMNRGPAALPQPGLSADGLQAERAALPGANMQPRSYRGVFFAGAAMIAVAVAGAVATVIVHRAGIDLSSEALAAEKKPAQADARSAAARPDNTFDQQARQAGIGACKDVFPVLGLAATSGAAFTASSSWSEAKPDDHSVQSLVGLSFDAQALKGKGAGVVYSAPVDGKCEGLFVRVVPVPQSCTEFAATLPKESKVDTDLSGVPLITLPSGWQSMLIPAPANGCVVVTTTRAAG